MTWARARLKNIRVRIVGATVTTDRGSDGYIGSDTNAGVSENADCVADSRDTVPNETTRKDWQQISDRRAALKACPTATISLTRGKFRGDHQR
jgi:hypothetical protein